MQIKPSSEMIELAHIISDIFGTKPSVTNNYDENEENSINILTCEDSPILGVTSVSTVGLYTTTIVDKQGITYDHGVELVCAGFSEATMLTNIVSTGAFCIIKDHWPCYPGFIYPDVLKMYNASTTLSHIMFVPPTLWEGKLNKTFDVGNRKVTFLMVLPISEKEMYFAEENGSKKLEVLLEKNKVNFLDFNRPSIL